MKGFILISIVSSALLAGVGNISAAKGEVSILRAGETLKGESGFELEKKDIVKTIGRSKAQILFEDETVITIGKDSEFKIEDYFYEENNRNSKTQFKVAKGFFKAITGNIGKIAKDKFKIKTKTATMGIRGTHIVGLIEDDFESIACTKGAIYVEANGVTVDVLEGEITEIAIGSAPSSARELKSEDLNKLNSGLSSAKVSSIGKSVLANNQEKISDALNQIRDVKDTDVKLAIASKLESDLNAQFDSELSTEFFKTKVSEDFEDVDWGFYTEDEVESKGNIYMVGDTLFDSELDAIAKAIPVELWIDAQVSLESEVANSIGFDESNSMTYAHWDGKSDYRELKRYSGEFLGYVRYPDSGEFVLVPLDEKNSVDLTIDFGNRYMFGDVKFSATDPKDETKFDVWNIKVAEVGKFFVSPSGYIIYNGLFPHEDTTADLIGAKVFNSKFYGESANEVGGYLELVSNSEALKTGEYNSENDKVAYGIILANEQEVTQMRQIESNSNEYFSWGYWAESGDSSSNMINPLGAWVRAENIEQTSEATIESLIAKGVMASYSGDIFGTVSHSISKEATDLMQNGVINLDFDFAKATATGALGFDAGVDKWHIGIGSSIVEPTGFEFNEVGVLDSSSEQLNYFEGGGKFYGNEAEHIIGGFEASSTDGDIAIGAFKASQ